MVRIAEFINTVVGTRKVNNNKRAVVMKLDVEVRIIPDSKFALLTEYQGAGAGDLSRFDPQWSPPAPGLYLY